MLTLIRRLRRVLALSLALVLLSVVVPAGPSAASPVAADRVHPLRGPDGRVLRNVRNQLESGNWSGYVVARYGTGKSYTTATATWVVPEVSAAPGFGTSYSSSWVGIGGFFTDSTESTVYNDLIQLGTEQDASSTGATSYFAWYETLPKPCQRIKGLVIHPGDRITASLSESPATRRGKTSQYWTLTMKDVTTGRSWSTGLTYNSSLSSAEWIQEAPSSGSGILPLADFGNVTFDPGTADGASPGLSDTDAVVMVDPHGQTSNVSGPDSDGDGFAAAWGNGSLTPVNPPAS